MLTTRIFPCETVKDLSYIGGKARGASHILAVLNDPRFDDMDYLEPFVGMAHILRPRESRESAAIDEDDLQACRRPPSRNVSKLIQLL